MLEEIPYNTQGDALLRYVHDLFVTWIWTKYQSTSRLYNGTLRSVLFATLDIYLYPKWEKKGNKGEEERTSYCFVSFMI